MGKTILRDGDAALFIISGTPETLTVKSRADGDALRPLVDLEFAGTPTEPLTSTAVVASVRWRFRVLTACESVGIARRALDIAVEHARTRTQFGRPIGSFQAVSHPLAQNFAESDQRLSARLPRGHHAQR